MSRKEYLGDSVYATCVDDDTVVRLTTENGMVGDPSNTIVVDRFVYKALVEYVQNYFPEWKRE